MAFKMKPARVAFSLLGLLAVGSGSYAIAAEETVDTQVQASRTSPWVTHVLLTERGVDSATLTWQTSEAVASTVNLGLTDTYELEAVTSDAGTHHSVNLTNLAPNTTYFYQIQAKGSDGSGDTSSALSFTTLDSTAEAPLILASVHTTFDERTGFLKVTTSEDTRAWVEYGINVNRPYTTPVSPYSKTHGIPLEYAMPGQVFNNILYVEDADGNISSLNTIWSAGEIEAGLVATTDKPHVYNSVTPRTLEKCDFLVSDIAEGDTVYLDCLIDLEGQSYRLAPEVNLVYNGGDMINGELSFNGGSIDLALLNSSVYLDGSVQATTSHYDFDKLRWNIVEGEVSDERALLNRKLMTFAFETTAKLGVTKVTLDALDAYFDVGLYGLHDNPLLSGILLPSNFHLLMTDSTVLRTQPNGREAFNLIGMFDAQNVTIEGGTLIGERDQHNYDDPNGTNPLWGHLMKISASKNITIKDVTAKNALADGLSIASWGAYTSEDHIETQNVLVTGCTFENNRRLGMAITAGKDIIVEDNLFIDSGRSTDLSEGISPGYAIDIEGYRRRDAETDEIYYWERPYNITIRNNIETNSEKGAFISAIADNVVIENNVTDGGISLGAAFDSKIINNIISRDENRDDYPNDFGLGTGYDGATTFYPGDNDVTGNNEVYGNRLNGLGIYVTGRDTKIFNNRVIDAPTSFYVQNAVNNSVYKNTAISERAGAYGLMARGSIDGVEFRRNTVTVEGRPIQILFTNIEEDQEHYQFKIKNNTFTATAASQAAVFSNVNNVIFKKNELIDSAIQIYSTRNSKFNRNDIDTDSYTGIAIDDESVNLKIKRNTIAYPSNKECISDSAGENIIKKFNMCMPK